MCVSYDFNCLQWQLNNSSFAFLSPLHPPTSPPALLYSTVFALLQLG